MGDLYSAIVAAGFALFVPDSAVQEFTEAQAQTQADFFRRLEAVEAYENCYEDQLLSIGRLSSNFPDAVLAHCGRHPDGCAMDWLALNPTHQLSESELVETTLRHCEATNG